MSSVKSDDGRNASDENGRPLWNTSFVGRGGCGVERNATKTNRLMSVFSNARLVIEPSAALMAKSHVRRDDCRDECDENGRPLWNTSFVGRGGCDVERNATETNRLNAGG